jgi:hypothetical protein
VDVEAVREEEQLAGRKIGADLVGIELGRGLVGNQDHDHVGPLVASATV